MVGIYAGRVRGLLLGCIAATLFALATAGSAQAFSIDNLSLTPSNPNSGSPSATQASSHPDVSIDMTFSGDDDARNLAVHLPPGLLGNPLATPRCTDAQFNSDSCPANTQVGSVIVTAHSDLLPLTSFDSHGSVYNIVPENGEPGRLGVSVPAVAGLLGTTRLESPNYLRTAAGVKSDFGLDSFLVDIPRTLSGTDITITRQQLTFFGLVGGKAFMTLPSACIPANISAEATSWGGASTSKVGTGFTPTGCASVPFTPDLEIEPTSSRTETATGFQIAINFPEEELPIAQSTGHAADIRLPVGVVISPGVANGLEFCTDEQFGIDNNAPVTCPAGSAMGDTSFFSGGLGKLDGRVYQGVPKPGQQIRLVTVVEKGATRIKFLDIVTPDPSNGQLLNEYHDVGQLPFTRFEYRFRGGANPALVTPSTCGTHSGTSLGTPWLGAPDFRANITGEASFSTSYDGAGAPCPAQLPFAPTLGASVTTTEAAASPAVSVTLTRPDRQQLIKNTTVHMPGGLLGKLTGMTLCPKANATAGTCPATTLVGSALAHVGAGASVAAFPGRVYLTEPPNAGDVAGLSIVIPAVAGPLNFGNVVQVAGIKLRQDDFGLDVTTTDFPRFQQGIPVLLRDVTITVDKKGFLLNPTGCSDRAFSASFNGFQGSTATSSTPYKATGCDKLNFRPALNSKAGDARSTKKGGHPPFSTVLTVPSGDAANKKVTVALPTDFSVNLAGLTTLCTADQINARACPAGSKVGSANASSPLLPGSLTGDVYIVQLSKGALPSLAFYLDNPLLSLRFTGVVSLGGGRITTIFDNLPDVPIDKFQLTLNGGDKGTLTANSDLCAKAIGLDAEYLAHSGKLLKARGPIDVEGCSAAERAALRPSATATLYKRTSGKPELRVTAKKAKNGVRLKSIKVTLPKSLKGSPKAAKSGLRVTAAGKSISRKSWKVTGRSMTITLPKTGKSTVILIARKGAVKPSKTLRTSKKAPKLRLTVSLTDTDNRKFALRVPVKLKNKKK